MRQDYYLLKRKNGKFYVEFITPENREKMSARSYRGSRSAQVKVELWKVNGIPTLKEGRR